MTQPASDVMETYERDGFVNAGPMLDAGELRELRAEIERLIDAFENACADRKPTYAVNLSTVEGEVIYQFVNLWEVSEPFRRLIAHPRIVEAAAALAGTSDLQVWFDQAQCKTPRNGGAAEWHQDAMYWAQIEPKIALTAWVALDDADVENGCMWMVPGSHRWGLRAAALQAQGGRRDPEIFGQLPALKLPAAVGQWRAPRPCPVRAGEVHFHHCLTWHGSPVNRSSRSRRAIGIHYLPAGIYFSGRRTTHPLAARIRVPKGAPMFEDGERFPIVLQDGRRVAP
jgi:phytanoyl-CoA hydroxylase